MKLKDFYNYYIQKYIDVDTEFIRDCNCLNAEMDEVVEQLSSTIFELYFLVINNLGNKYSETPIDFEELIEFGNDIELEEQEWTDVLYQMYILYKAFEDNRDMFFQECVLWRFKFLMLEVYTYCFYSITNNQELHWDYSYAQDFDKLVQNNCIYDRQSYINSLKNIKTQNCQQEENNFERN